MDDAVQRYIDGIPAEHRPLFDRLHQLVQEEHPDAEVVLSYRLPTYKVGRHRLHIGAWKHGVSLYGWSAGHDGGFTERHPELTSGAGTIKLRPTDAEVLREDELRDLIRASLSD